MITKVNINWAQYRFSLITDIFPHRKTIRMHNQKPSGGFSDIWLTAYFKRAVLKKFPLSNITCDYVTDNLIMNIRVTILAGFDSKFQELLNELASIKDNLEPIDEGDILRTTTLIRETNTEPKRM